MTVRVDTVTYKIIWRTVKLFVIGVATQGADLWGGGGFDMSNIRIPGILQRIAWVSFPPDPREASVTCLLATSLLRASCVNTQMMPLPVAGLLYCGFHECVPPTSHGHV